MTRVMYYHLKCGAAGSPKGRMLWPTDVWTRPDSLPIPAPLPCGIVYLDKGYGSKPRTKINPLPCGSPWIGQRLRLLSRGISLLWGKAVRRGLGYLLLSPSAFPCSLTLFQLSWVSPLPLGSTGSGQDGVAPGLRTLSTTLIKPECRFLSKHLSQICMTKKTHGDSELLTGAGLVYWELLGKTEHAGRHRQDGR